MYKSVIYWLFLLILLTGCGSPAYQLVNEGNAAFEEEEYETALQAYQEAQQVEPELLEPTYNAANAYYHQDGPDVATTMLEQVVEQAEGMLAQYGFYNLGNIFFHEGQYDLAIEAYKAALRLKSDDWDAKHNLELALLRRNGEEEEQQEEEKEEDEQQEDEQEQQQQDEQEQQGQEEQQDQQEQPQDQQEQENEQEQQEQQQQQQEQEQEQQEQEQQQQQEQSEEGQEQQNSPQDQEQEQQDESDEQSGAESNSSDESQEQEEQAPSQPLQVMPLTPEQARQLLESIQNSSQTLQEKLQEIYIVPGGALAEDW